MPVKSQVAVVTLKLANMLTKALELVAAAP